MENTRIGPFQVLKKLGTHRRHRVYRARQIEQDVEVALKFISVPSGVEMATALNKIQAESETLKSLSHRNLVQFYGAGIEGDQIFFASKLIKGESLASILSRRSRLSTQMSIDFARQIAKCLEYLHAQHLLHSKLTPDKILMDRRGVVRVSDLRLNRAKKRRWDDHARHQLEIAAYMAPEVLAGQGATEKSDLYSLGVILFEMLTGKLPFETGPLPKLLKNKRQANRPSVIEHAINCPVWLEQLVQRMLQPNPEDRPISAGSIVTQLKEIKAFDKRRPSVLSGASPDPRAAHHEEQLAILESVREAKQQDAAQARGPVGWVLAAAQTTLQSRFLIAAGLAALLAGLTWLAWPPSNGDLLQAANGLSESMDPTELKQAAEMYSRILARDPDAETRTEAEEKRELILRYLLVERAKTGGTRLEDAATQRFIAAYRQDAEGRNQFAADQYAALIEDGADVPGHVLAEAAYRLERVNDRLAAIQVQAEEIENLIADAKAVSKSDASAAIQILQNIIERYASQRDLKAYVKLAQVELDRLQQL